MNRQTVLNQMCNFTMALDMVRSIEGMVDYFIDVAQRDDDAKIFEALDKLHECLQKTDDALLNVQGQLATGIIVKKVGNGDEEVQD